MNQATSVYEAGRMTGIGATLTAAQDRPPRQVESMLRTLEEQVNALGNIWSTHVDTISPIVTPYPATPEQVSKDQANSCPLAERLRILSAQLSRITSYIQQTTKQVEL